MNAIRFGIYAGIIWAIVSVVLIEISVVNGSESTWVELDFRFLSGIVLIALYWLDLTAGLSDLLQIIQHGMPINAYNTTAAIASGFIDGFFSGFFIAVYYNLISIIFESKNLPASLKFGVATGTVFGFCSGLIGLVSMYYDFEISSFSFSIRPVFLAFTALPEGFLTTLRDSYFLFPHTYPGVIEWTLWGFVDGFIAGAILAYIVLKIKSYSIKA